MDNNTNAKNSITGSATPDEKELKTDLSGLYRDETQDTIRSLQESADRMTENYHNNPFGAKDLIADIIFFFVVTATAFGWLLLILLIVSFVAHTYIHLKIDKMILASAIFAVVAAVVYIIKKAQKYIRLSDEKKRRKEEKERAVKE